MQGSYQDNCKTSYLLFKSSYKSIIKLKQIVIKFIFTVQDVMIEGAEVIQSSMEAEQPVLHILISDKFWNLSWNHETGFIYEPVLISIVCFDFNV